MPEYFWKNCPSPNSRNRNQKCPECGSLKEKNRDCVVCKTIKYRIANGMPRDCVSEAYGYKDADDLSVDASVRLHFENLTRDWKVATRHLSRTDQIASHPAYKAIIEMGRDVVPLILNDLETSGGSWYPALRQITGANPVTEGMRGNVGEIKRAWLEWARNNEYQW